MTTIEWTDATWNPTVGCSRVSAGCDNCYAMHVAHRGLSPEHAGLTKLRPKDHARPGVDWTGEVRTLSERLAIPLRWRKPRRVFVDSMSDLFHPAVSFEFIAAVFGVMAATPMHTYQVLTKRPERAREFFEWLKNESPVHTFWRPLPNVWLGTSVEDQATAEERVFALLLCPAALRLVSYEPAISGVDFSPWLDTYVGLGLDWIIVGGESGPRARPFDVGWAREVIEQARGTTCKVFVKQLGARPYFRNDDYGSDPEDRGSIREVMLTDAKGGDWDEWPEDLRVREMPEVTR